MRQRDKVIYKIRYKVACGKDSRYKDSEGSVEIVTGILYESDSLMLVKEVVAAYKAKLDRLPAAERERYFTPATMRSHMKNLLCSVYLDDLLAEFETPTARVMRPYGMPDHTLLYLHPEKEPEQKREWLKRNSVIIHK
jgi:hypothetical protein